MEKSIEVLNRRILKLQKYKKNYLPSMESLKNQLHELNKQYSLRFFDPNKKYLKCFNSFIYENSSSLKWNTCEESVNLITDLKITQLRKYYLDHLQTSLKETDKKIKNLRTKISTINSKLHSFRNSSSCTKDEKLNTPIEKVEHQVESIENNCPIADKESYCFTLSGLEHDWGPFRQEDCATKKECLVGKLICQKWDNPDTLFSCIQHLYEKKYLSSNEQLMILGLGHGAWFELLGGSTTYNKGNVLNLEFLKKLNPYAEEGIKIGFFLDSCSQGMLQSSLLSGEYISTKAQPNFCLLTSSPYHVRAYGGDSISQLKDSKDLEEAGERMSSLYGATSSGLPLITTGMNEVLKSRGSIESFQKMFQVPALLKINDNMMLKYKDLLQKSSLPSEEIISLGFSDLIYYSIRNSSPAFAKATITFMNLLGSNSFDSCRNSLTSDIDQQLVSKDNSTSQVEHLTFWKKYFETLNDESRMYYKSAVPICDYLRFTKNASCNELSSICDEMMKTAQHMDEDTHSLKSLTPTSLSKQQFFSTELFSLLSSNTSEKLSMINRESPENFEFIYFGLNNGNDAFQNYLSGFWALIHDSIIKHHPKGLHSAEEVLRAKACAQITL
jgi:hypothetical protein